MKLNTKTKVIFEEMPAWKALLRFSWPNILMMASIGLYTFMDSIIAIHLAGPGYSGEANAIGKGVTGADLTRLFMNSANPIVSFLNAVGLLFGMGTSTRYSINIGARRYDRAFSTMRSGMMSVLILSVVTMISLYFTAESWMSAMYEGVEGSAKTLIISTGFKYVEILIFALPLFVFNQLISGLFRSEGKMRVVTAFYVLSLVTNLFLDYILMGPVGMGIRGGAIATAVSYLQLTICFVFVIILDKKTHIKFKNLFGVSGIRLISIIGILLVGIAPFLRNFAQSITGTFESREIGDISAHFNGNALYSRNILAGVFPVFGLAFPLIFGFSQGATPIASYNYGAGNFKRVRSIVFWSVIYAVIFGAIIYGFIAAPYMLGQGLLVLLDVQQVNMSESLRVLSILMLSLPIFGLSLGGMVLFSSTDRLLFSLIANSLRGFIYFFPFLYLFKWLALNTSIGSLNFFWWFYPTLVAATSITVLFMMIIVFKRVNHKHFTLDERLQKFTDWIGIKYRPIVLPKGWSRIGSPDSVINSGIISQPVPTEKIAQPKRIRKKKKSEKTDN